MKTLEELEAAWRAACAARDAANIVLHEKSKDAEVAFESWEAAAKVSNDAFSVFRDAALAADEALDALCAAREAASIAPMGDA